MPHQFDAVTPPSTERAAPAGDPPPARARTPIVVACLVLAACAVYALVSATRAFDAPLLEAHSFRQTHTAISAYWMLGEAPKLGYETPVLGPPWSIPFELPIYQWTVAAAVTALGTPLDPTGRAVSLLFFWLTMLPLFRVLSVFGMSRPLRLAMLALVAANPFYLFWSRAFLPESTAVFLATAFLAFAVTWVRSRRPRDLALCALFGALAGMQKITTFVPFLGAAWLVLLHGHARSAGRLWPLRGVLLPLAVLTGIPVAATAAWTRHADALKELNPIGQVLTSAALTRWNFGTLDLRLDGDFMYGAVLNQPFETIYHPLLFATCAVAVLLAQRRRLAVLVLALLYASAPLVFTRVHGHTYYAFANLIFLVVAIGLCCAGLIERGGWRRRVGLALLGATFGLSIYRHQTLFLELQTRHPDTQQKDVAGVVRRVTEPDEIVVVYGDDWSSVIPYYAQRRALMFPSAIRTQVAERALARVAEERVGAMVVFDRKIGVGWYPPAAELSAQRRGFGLSEVPAYADARVTVYPPARHEAAFREYWRAADLVERGDAAAALPLLDAALAALPHEPRFWLARARAHTLLDDHAVTAADAERAIACDPTDSAWLLQAGEQLYRAFGRSAKAGTTHVDLLRRSLACFDAGLELDPTHPTLLHDRGLAYATAGDARAAARDQERLAGLTRPRATWLDANARLVRAAADAPRK